MPEAGAIKRAKTAVFAENKGKMLIHRTTTRDATGALARFARSECGAATVDWVVLTAASVAMGMAVMSYVRDGVEDLSNDIRDALSGITIKTSFEDWDEFRANPDAELGGGQAGADPQAGS